MNKTIKILLLALPAFAVLVMFFLVPLGSVLVEPFLDKGEAFLGLWSDPLFLKGLKGSTLLALTAGFLSVLVGVPVALRLSTMKEKARLLAMIVDKACVLPDEVLMVGDASTDRNAAEEVGTLFYGTGPELKGGDFPWGPDLTGLDAWIAEHVE